jgi:hypothetical protein
MERRHGHDESGHLRPPSLPMLAGQHRVDLVERFSSAAITMIPVSFQILQRCCSLARHGSVSFPSEESPPLPS